MHEQVKYFSPQAYADVLGVPLNNLRLEPESQTPFLEKPNGRIPVINPAYGADTLLVEEIATGQLVRTAKGEVVGTPLEPLIALLEKVSCKEVPCEDLSSHL